MPPTNMFVISLRWRATSLRFTAAIPIGRPIIVQADKAWIGPRLVWKRVLMKKEDPAVTAMEMTQAHPKVR